MTMSSGAESDDADLTDGDSAEDNWSDLEGNILTIFKSLILSRPPDINDQGASSMLSFYSPIVKHYCANWSRSSDTWDEAAFALTRVNILDYFSLCLLNSFVLRVGLLF